MPVKRVETSTPPQLIDIPVQYLTEKGHWSEFKRSMNTCGLTWNLPDWSCTILYNGEDYKYLIEKGKNMNAILHPTVVDCK